VRSSSYSPDPNETNGYRAAECVLESLSDVIITVGLIEFIRERDFLHIIFRE
jgi:hypothetical protein